jgi:DNA-binding transcriptional LysR family regulator
MIDIRKFDTGLLITFNTLYELRSVSLSAQKLCLTQSTVSAALARLRDLFEDELFLRTKRGIAPTPLADTIAPKVFKIVKDIEDLASPAQFHPEKVKGTLVLSVNDYMQTSIVLPLVKRLRAKAPGLRVSIRPMVIKTLKEQLASGDIDFAFSIPEFISDELPFDHLYLENYVCAVRKNHPVKGEKMSLDEFCAYDHIVVSPESGDFSTHTDKLLKVKRKKRHVRLSVANFLILESLLQQDDLIAMVPERLFMASKTLRKLEIPLKVPGFDVISVWHQRVENNPLHRWLRSQILEVV